MSDYTPPQRKILSHQISSGGSWVSLEPDEEGKNETKDKAADYLKLLLTSHRLVVLAGSGTSLSEGGPSMGALWTSVSALDGFADVKDVISFGEDKNVEEFLSQCHNAKPYISKSDTEKVDAFLLLAEKEIFEKCSGFIEGKDSLETHESFLSKLTRRRSKSLRPMVYTTNYDLCFERAASKLGLTVVDGFSYSQPRYFDPNFFGYDFVRRSHHGKEQNELVDGVIHLLKIHGSVDWEIHGEKIRQSESPEDGKRCLIYPASTKYQHSYTQPYLEMMARYLTVLREPQTSLIIVGFGFNDDHLSAPILSAIKSNHSLNVIAVAPDLVDLDGVGFLNKNWEFLAQLAKNPQNRVTLLNADFNQFVDLIPDLKALSPDQNFISAIQKITTKSDSHG